MIVWTRHPDNPDLATLMASELVGEARPIAIECVTPRGPRWVEVVMSDVTDDHGTPSGFRGVSRDVQERRDAEIALRTSEERFRSSFDHATIGMIVVGGDGKPVEVNQAFSEMLGYAPAELLTRSMDSLAHPDDVARATVETMRLIMGEIRAYQMEKRYLHRDGHLVWGLLSCSLTRDALGQPLHLIAQVQDISERKAAEEALCASEERFRSAFDDAAIGMTLTTIDGRTIRVNPALCVMLGYTEAELLGCTVEDLVHPDDRRPLEIDRERLNAGFAQSYRADRRYLDKQGRVLWVHVTASLVRDASGSPLYFLGQIQDFTERRQAEEALKVSLEKLRLLARRQVSIREEERKRLGFDLHDDVCQELVGVGILVESLRRKLTPMAVEHAAEFQRVVRYVGEVVEHLRLLARELRPFLLQDLGLDGSLRSLAEGMSTPTLAITADIPEPIPRLDEETEVTVYRIAQEALANAVRHAGARGIVVALAVSDGVLELRVGDDGCGFDPSARPAMALGLASMEERALALGGRLEIHSATNGGTTVALRCPLELPVPGRFRELAGPSPTRSSSPLSAVTIPPSAARG